MAIRLDGKQIAAEIRGSLKEKVDEIRKMTVKVLTKVGYV